jgi:hypothetical protein
MPHGEAGWLLAGNSSGGAYLFEAPQKSRWVASVGPGREVGWVVEWPMPENCGTLTGLFPRQEGGAVATGWECAFKTKYIEVAIVSDAGELLHEVKLAQQSDEIIWHRADALGPTGNVWIVGEQPWPIADPTTYLRHNLWAWLFDQDGNVLYETGPIDPTPLGLSLAEVKAAASGSDDRLVVAGRGWNDTCWGAYVLSLVPGGDPEIEALFCVTDEDQPEPRALVANQDGSTSIFGQIIDLPVPRGKLGDIFAARFQSPPPLLCPIEDMSYVPVGPP